jgi:hypothetical protein
MDGPMAGVAKHLKGFPRRYAQLKMPWFTQMQILDQPILELNPLNFHLFFFGFSTSQKGAFYQIVTKKQVPNFTL